MGAKDWMLMYADGNIRPILQSEPMIDREATRQVVERLYTGHAISEIADGTLFEQANPPDRHVYAACFPGLTVICAADAALDQPSELATGFRAEARGRTLYLHAMHSVVDWFAYAIWTGDGQLKRSLSLSPDSGIMENIGSPLAFEAPYWAGEKALEPEDDEEDWGFEDDEEFDDDDRDTRRR